MVTALTTSVSNEMSRILPKEIIGAGMGLSQLTQFLGGAFGVALTGSALEWLNSLPPWQTFSTIFWAIAGLILVSTICYVQYTKT